MSRDQMTRAAKPAGARALACAAALAVLLSASCVESAPAGPIATLIPSEAIAAVVVESPYKLYRAAEEFWKAAGLDKSLGSDLQGLLEKTVPGSDQALQALDFARPWAFAVLPPGGPAEGSLGGAKKTRQLLYVPFRSAPEAFVQSLAGASFKIVAKAKGYVVLSDAEGQLPFPPAKGADLSRLSRYPAASVKLWGDPAAIRRATADAYKPIAEAVRRFVTEPPSGADPAAAAKALGELGLSFLAQLGLADACLEFGAPGLTLRAGAAAAKGSDLQKVLAAAALAPSALDWASQVDAGALYGYAWSMDPAIAAGLYDRFTAPLFAAMGLPKDLADRASALQAKWSKAAGPRGAMSLDMDIDASAVAGLGSADSSAVAELIKKMLKIRFNIFQEVKSEAGYRALVKGLSSDPDFLAFSKAYAQAFGLSFAISSQDKKVGSFSYGELGMDLKVVDPSKLGALEGSAGSDSAREGMEAALAALSSMVSARWAISNGRFSATSGDASALSALATRKAAEKGGLGAEAAFAAFAKTMPAKPVMVGSMSMRKLMALAASIAEAGSKGAKASIPDPSLFGSWYSYLAVDKRGLAPGLEFGLLLPAGDIGAVASASGALGKRAAAPDGGI